MSPAPAAEWLRSGPKVRASILVIEPGQSVADELVEALVQAGYRSRAVATAHEAYPLLVESKPDVVLLGWSLPGREATTLCHDLRARGDILVLVVSASGDEAAAVASLEAGGDGFLTKPFSRRELLARVDALLRRSHRGGRQTDGEVYVVGDLTVDVARHEVWLRGHLVAFPLREFQLLEVLVASPGKVWSRQALMQRVWGETPLSGTKSLGVHVSRIRAKIEEKPSSPTRLLTVRGAGYTYVPSAAPGPSDAVLGTASEAPAAVKPPP